MVELLCAWEQPSLVSHFPGGVKQGSGWPASSVARSGRCAAELPQGGGSNDRSCRGMAGGIDISVCVATYRRPAGLARLLESLQRQKLPDGVSVEIWVVDNDPDSPAIAPPGVGWLREPRRNIAHARNRALLEARGEWLAFIDDDETADEDWLSAYWTRAQQGEPDGGDADGFFGPVIPVRFSTLPTAKGVRFRLRAPSFIIYSIS